VHISVNYGTSGSEANPQPSHLQLQGILTLSYKLIPIYFFALIEEKRKSSADGMKR
jgi:hypothetical protein